MTLPPFELMRPFTIADASALLTVPESELIAGGTQLLFAMKNRSRSPRRLVDLSAIPALRTIVFDAQHGLTAGAGVTLAQLAAHRDVLRHYPVVASAARLVATPQIQSMATVAGNVCQNTCCLYVDRAPEQRDSLAPCLKLHGFACHVVTGSEACRANYAGDLAPVLIALGATATIVSASSEAERPIPALFTGDGMRPIALEPGEIMTAIHLPPPRPRSGAAYLKLRQRQSLEYPLLGVAAAVTLAADGTCESAAVVLTGVDRRPIVVEAARSLIGQVIADSALERVAQAASKSAHPVKNAFGYSPGYRTRVIKPFVVRAVREAVAHV